MKCENLRQVKSYTLHQTLRKKHAFRRAQRVDTNKYISRVILHKGRTRDDAISCFNKFVTPAKKKLYDRVLNS